MGDRFHILDIPGVGAHATVCVVLDAACGERRALKVLRRRFEPDSVEARRVRDEGRILARLRHPNLPRVHEQIEVDQRQVLVMDAVDGPPVARIVRRVGALPPAVALTIAHEVAGALAYAFEAEASEAGAPAKLVHRDLNLENVMLDVSGRVVVLDFGLARAEFADRETRTMLSLVASPGYQAPEGIKRGGDRGEVDVYSLGVCLYVMATGHLPMLPRTAEKHAARLDEALQYLRGALASDPLGERIAALFSAACAHDPAARPTMAALRDQLVAHADLGALRAWSADTVQPLHAARKRVEPVTHDAYPELAFLEQVELGGVSATAVGERIFERFLERPGWQRRIDDLGWLLERYPDAPLACFERALAPATQWWFWREPLPEPRGIGVLLTALSGRPTARLPAIARALTRHQHPAVRALAAAVVRGEAVALERCEALDWTD